MDLEEAIKTAITYEKRVRDVYLQAAEKTGDDAVGARVFGALAEEETGHVAYLEHCLAECRRSGAVTPTALKTVVPAAWVITEGVKRLERTVAPTHREMELDLLKQALEAETETCRFYEDMVETLGPEGQALFRPFMEIENGHRDLVQAEIDALTGTGFWFDFQEFNLEAG